MTKPNETVPKRRSGHATGMAGEFFVMERLFRGGHEPALTLGKAKTIDIIVRTKQGQLKTVSVKSASVGGKWGVGNTDLSKEKDLLFVFLHYKNFGNLATDPEVWILTAADVQKWKRPWIKKSKNFAIYYIGKNKPKDLDKHKKWELIG